jgi:hypothetical protein
MFWGQRAEEKMRRKEEHHSRMTEIIYAMTV